MRKFHYNPAPLQESARQLADERSVTSACEAIKLSRAQFYKVVNGQSASYGSLISVAKHLGVKESQLAITVAE